MNYYQLQFSAYNGFVFAIMTILEEANTREEAIYSGHKKAKEFISDEESQITFLSAIELPKPK